VEGYLDVVALHQAGFSNAVSPMGTALTEDQMRLLKKYTRRIVLALDADAAGEKATLRGLEVAREAMDHSEEINFDIRGLLRHEKRLQADLRVTTLPEGLDPDEVVNRDPAEWQGIVENASPLVIHVMENLARSRDVADPRVKNEIAAAILPLIEEVPGTVERDAYRQRLARLLRVSEEALFSMRPTRPVSLPPARQSRGQPPTQSPRQVISANPLDPTPEMEKHILAWLVTNPPMLFRVDRKLRQADIPRLNPQDFSQSELQQAFQALTTAVEQDQQESREYLVSRLEPALLSDLTKDFDFANQDKINEDDLVADVYHTIIRLRKIRCKDALAQLRYLQEEETPEGNAIPFQDQVVENMQMIKKLESAMRLDQQKRKL
jgi:DNA primase